MALNKQKGNMYGFVTHTWNPIKGVCPHHCSYCYMKKFNGGLLITLNPNTINDNLGAVRYIFVGSSTDIFCQEVPAPWINRIINHIKKYPDNKYLFQTKNPLRFFDPYIDKFPDNSTFCTTIETNREDLLKKYTCAPPLDNRIVGISKINSYPRMLTIEPIMDFDIDPMLDIINKIRPNYINIGADSGGNCLPEPDFQKTTEFISELNKMSRDRLLWEDGLTINLKNNLQRLL